MFTISCRRYDIIFVQRRGTPRSAQAAGDAAEISADKPTPTACFIWFPSCKAVAQGTGHGPFHIYGRDSGQPCPAQNYRPVQVDDKMKTPPELSLRGAKRRGNLGKALPNCTGQCRGAACRSRRNAADSNGPPLKWQRLPDLSLRGRFAPVAISGRQLRFRRGFPVIHPGTARFPRRFAPRNGNSDSLAPPNHHCNTRNCRRRSLSAATDAIGWYVLIGSLQTASAFPRLPRPLWGLAMTHQGSVRCTSPPQ